VAERLAVSGALLTSQEAFGVGLVDEVVALETVVDRAVRWCERLLALPAEAMRSTRWLARAELVAIFEGDLERELEQVIASWWSPETRGTLRALAERLGKKVG
jgi:enoyl-CoA hydratase/carnithine racemase